MKKGLLVPLVVAASVGVLLVSAWVGFALRGTPASPEPRWDVLIAGGLLVDGSGSPPRRADVAVRDGRIAAVGSLSGEAELVVDASGRVVAPGFIDVHTHSESIADLPLAENFLRMGVTTVVTGNCGSSATDLEAFFEKLESVGTGPNVASLIGHNSLRRRAMGGNFTREPSETEEAEMHRLAEDAMRAGALGLSTGLIYNPGTFATTEEIVALARIAAAHGGIYVSHMRNENYRIFEAVEELLTIAREAAIPAQISHIKLSGPTAWGRSEELLALLDRVREEEGLRIAHDQYAYPASSTGLSQLIPAAAREGSAADFLARVADPEQKAEIARQMERMRAGIGREDYAYAVVARYRADPELAGLSIPEAAMLRRGSDSIEDQVELILEIHANGGGGAVYHTMDEADLRRFMAHPMTMVASDGGPRRFGADLPHPRSYGNNARVLARYVREEGLLSLEEAVRKMTSLPASFFQLEGRGEVRVGAIADLVVFDPETVSDPADFRDPHRYATGFDWVVVNGVAAIAEGELSGERPGRPVRRGE